MKRIDASTIGGAADSWYISPEGYGAQGNGIADDTQALQDAITAAGQGQLTVRLTVGKVYRITGAVTINKNGFRMLGGSHLSHAQAGGGHILCDGAAAKLVVAPPSGYIYRVVLADIHLRGTNGALTAIDMDNSEEPIFQRVSAWGFGGKAFDFDTVHLGSFDYLLSTVNSIGVYLHNSSQNAFYKPNIYGSENQVTTPTEAGVKFSGSSGNNQFIAPWMENNRVAFLFTNAVANLKCDLVSVVDGQFSAYFDESPGNVCRIAMVVNETNANQLNVRPVIFERCQFNGSHSAGTFPYFFEFSKNTCTAAAGEVRGLFVVRDCMAAGTAPSTAWVLSDEANVRVVWEHNQRGNAACGEAILSGSGTVLGADIGGTWGYNTSIKHRSPIVVAQQFAAASAPNGSIFEDTADGKLKYKNLAGSVQLLVN